MLFRFFWHSDVRYLDPDIVFKHIALLFLNEAFCSQTNSINWNGFKSSQRALYNKRLQEQKASPLLVKISLFLLAGYHETNQVMIGTVCGSFCQTLIKILWLFVQAGNGLI